jgi:hypothetical protein
VKQLKKWLVLAALLPVTGCAAVVGEEEGDEAGSVMSNELIGRNALSSNALSSNALSSNALSSNALSSNALAPGALAAIEAPGEAGNLNRLFLRYAVGCALSAAQSFSFSWTDSHGTARNETYHGELGIAPEWGAGPLSAAGQQLVSACLAARTNWYGIQVILSLRSSEDPLTVPAGSAELTTYPDVEGVFWGNVFSTTPYLRACYNQATVANSRRAHRDCAAGHLKEDGSTEECGMIEIVGPCQDHCAALDGDTQHHPSCTDPDHGATPYVITTALP